MPLDVFNGDEQCGNPPSNPNIVSIGGGGCADMNNVQPLPIKRLAKDYFCGSSPAANVRNWMVEGAAKGVVVGGATGGFTGTVLGTPVGGVIGAVAGGVIDGAVGGANLKWLRLISEGAYALSPNAATGACCNPSGGPARTP